MKRRDFTVRGASLGLALALPSRWAAAQSAPAPADPLAPDPQAFRKAVSDFVGDATALPEGLQFDMAALADNPGAVPVKVRVTLPLDERLYCQELIVLAESNPQPLVCRLRFTPATGSAEAALRVRLSQSQTVHALARMSDGRVLTASQHVTVAASGCGM
ncbi:MAG: sulfur oxidation protein SoxY [Comamonadaceae bacterium]|nr:sulfur oxidation protein SoxY [Comamonadaceae bacterium]